ncbi:hypothetical protein [Prolixibacter sp. SD074]|jgi:hypothetical protein|uniref:hypothetical protein n=1 Tax=Prolixibacter sp. SD074 TaxID=2652391 RepID=UPI00126C4DEC|nr:hypothetical protein [Prolixibacter sp. SD074]GET30887.1 hypothetical protein SD074_30890 [Prolixibacter sp. SD074]
MGLIKVILLAIALVSLAIFGLAIQIVLKKNGKFPDTHVGHNREMKKRGIVCAQTFDRVEQVKVKKEQKLKNLKLAK